MEEDIFDYVVVGSGAGGGPVACRLALAGYCVLILEAGGTDERLTYQVPAFHGLATEDPALSWDFFVRHYADETQQSRDTKYVPGRKGILYPRAATVGGCTAHNAMITVYPHNSDWKFIADITGDSSWEPDKMRSYFERLEKCGYRTAPLSGEDPARHGFSGWLATSLAEPAVALTDIDLLGEIMAAMCQGFSQSGMANRLDMLLRFARDVFRPGIRDFLPDMVDPNDWEWNQASGTGVVLIPLAIQRGTRNGTREFIRQTAEQTGSKLELRPHSLVTRVIFDDHKRALGVEYLSGEHLYKADPNPSPDNTFERHMVRVRREVILAGGAFNTPQLLMLSGIGPAEHLQKSGITTLVDLPGVGENLQDRYEISVISQLNLDLCSLKGAKFAVPKPGEDPDPDLLAWQERREGLYTSNGVVLGIITRSSPERAEPDLFLFGLPSFFKGYFPGYSGSLEQSHDKFTWSILKAHTENTGGSVRLQSNDPRDPPEINFHYFTEGTDHNQRDLESVLQGVKIARNISNRTKPLVREEILPGIQFDTDDKLLEWIKNEAWGHHASCTCKIGADNDPRAVLDSKFRVRGVDGLRVVDASAFPRIPGLFIVTPVYMISEKAAEVILEDASRGQDTRRF
jgi:choline dehydrogenase